MDNEVDLSGEFAIWQREKKDVVARYKVAKQRLEEDLIFMGKTVVVITARTLHGMWSIVSGVFLIIVFSILWFTGEL